MKIETLLDAAQSVQGTKANLTVTEKFVPTTEMKTERLCCYITPAEKETFLSLIGRKPESEALRELVTQFISERNL